MKRVSRFIFLIFCAGCICGCGGHVRNAEASGELLYSPEYASGFSITSYGNSTVLNVTDPWQGARGVEKNIFLSRDGELPPDGFLGITLRMPLENVICMSSTHIAYIDAVGSIDAVKGVSGANYITNGVIRERYADGRVKDVGYDNYVNYEMITSLRPDVVLVYGVAGENMLERKLAELGVKVAYIGDYVENSPLGKAEWIVALGEMFGKRDEAVEIFKQIKGGYLETKEMVKETVGDKEKPVIMLNSPYRDTWFVPGDRSYMVRLIKDAGGEYACAGEDSEKSRALSGEAAFIAANRSDMWMNPGIVNTLSDLITANPKFADIPPVKNDKVYNCDARSTPEGGSDFWESGALNADVVLKDMVKIFHPELLPEHELYYFRKLK